MDAQEMDESTLWADSAAGKVRHRIEQYQPRSSLVVPYSSDAKWMEEVRKGAGSVQYLTIQNFECSLANFAFADEIVLAFNFNWRFSKGDLILERSDV